MLRSNVMCSFINPVIERLAGTAGGHAADNMCECVQLCNTIASAKKMLPVKRLS